MSREDSKAAPDPLAAELFTLGGNLTTVLDLIGRQSRPIIIIVNERDNSPCYKRTPEEWRQLHAEMIARHNALYPGDENVRNRIHPSHEAALRAMSEATLRTVKRRRIVCEY